MEERAVSLVVRGNFSRSSPGCDLYFRLSARRKDLGPGFYNTFCAWKVFTKCPELWLTLLLSLSLQGLILVGLQ